MVYTFYPETSITAPVKIKQCLDFNSICNVYE
jgi:hypothetical protein